MKHIVRIFLLLAVMSSASGHGMMVTVTGAGTDSCGDWVIAENAGGTPQFIYKTWVDGYLTGFNMSTILKKDILREKGIPEIYVLISDYCKKNPVKSIMMATNYIAVNVLGKPSNPDQTTPK